jgi:hypothetical protein
MSRFFRDPEFDSDYEELRAEARAERRRLSHWCDLCHGHTGPNSPCYDGGGEDDEPVQASDDQDDDSDDSDEALTPELPAAATQPIPLTH